MGIVNEKNVQYRKVIYSKFRFVICCVILFSNVFYINASTTDSILSVYSDGKFKTVYQTSTITNRKIANEVTDYLVQDFHNSPGNLFNWALKNLGLQNKNNELIIVFKSSSHNAKTGITHGVFDVIVPYFRTFKDITVDAIVTKTTLNNGIIIVKANIIHSSLLMKNAIGTLTLTPKRNDHFLVTTYVEIKFGWFFNIFITRNRYKSIVEWRIKKFSENIIDECTIRNEK